MFALCLPRLEHRVAPAGTVHQPACPSEYAVLLVTEYHKLCWDSRALTPSSPMKVLISTWNSSRYRPGADAGYIPAKGEERTPLGSKNNSDSHAARVKFVSRGCRRCDQDWNRKDATGTKWDVLLARCVRD